MKKNIIIFLFLIHIPNVTCIPNKEIPSSLYNEYTLSNKIPVQYKYRDDSYSSDKPRIFAKSQIDDLINKAHKKTPKYYGATDTWLYQAFDKYPIAQKKVAILGSVTPWYESIVLAYRGMPTTIEYNKIISKDKRVRVMTVDEYDKNPEQFDVLVSISSFEHDGLGRYGDPQDPIGDLKAMQKAKKMLKQNGLLYLTVPIGKDVLVWNLHRVYGPLRLPLLLDGWTIVDSFGFNPEKDFKQDAWENHKIHQPILVLRPN